MVDLKAVDEKLERLLVGMTRIEEQNKSLCGNLDRVEEDNKSHHTEFFSRLGKVETRTTILETQEKSNETQHDGFLNRIGEIETKTSKLETRLEIMDKVDDPETISKNTSNKVWRDVMYFLIPIIITIILALKYLGKI